MRDSRLTIKINKPAAEVFEFTTNPKNTPLWVPSIIKEETNEYPAKVGTIYRNTSDNKNWTEYLVSKFEKDKIFVFNKVNDTYHVQYTFKVISPNETELEYYEWMDTGELSEPFTVDILQKLKNLIESNK